jgi:cyclic pyranopterin phosphate synthase
MLYTCLFATQGYDLRALLRPERGRALSDEAIAGTVAAIWHERADRYSELRSGHSAAPAPRERIEMSYIGG